MQHLGDRYGDESLVALGVYYEGRALLQQARVREGLALLDEAMLAAVSDKLQADLDRRDLLRAARSLP